MSDDDLRAQLDDLEARFDALNRSRLDLRERIEALEAENERLRDQLAELSQVVDPDPADADYESLTRARKVHRVRRRLVEDAATSNAKAAMDYTAVKWLFDGHPSDGHCYDLMQLAANLDGFRYQERDGASNRVLVNLDAVNDETLIHAANNARGGEEV
jgi:cell division septum initiation protein DivIVA